MELSSQSGYIAYCHYKLAVSFTAPVTFFFHILGIEPKALNLLGKCCTNELHFQFSLCDFMWAIICL